MPSQASEFQRPDLARTFSEFDLEAARRGFIADQVLPVLDVDIQAANIGKIPLEALLQERNTARSPGGTYARQNYKLEQFSYACLENGAEEPIDQRQRAIYGRRYFDLETIATMRAVDVILRNREKRVADAVFNTSTWTGSALTTAITNEWDDFGNATPVEDIDAAIEKVFTNSGLEANALIVNNKVLRNLARCDEMIDQVKQTGSSVKISDPKLPLSAIADMLAPLLGLKKIIVAGSPRNSGKLGQAATITRVWSGEYAMICKVAESGDMMEPCIGRTFHYTGDGSAIDGAVESYYEAAIRGDVIRVRHDTDEKIIYAQAGHLLSNITT